MGPRARPRPPLSPGNHWSIREMTWSVMKAIAEKSLTSDWQMIFIPPLFFFFQFTSEDSTLRPGEEQVSVGLGLQDEALTPRGPRVGGRRGRLICVPALCPHRPPQGEAAPARTLGARAGLWPSCMTEDARPLCTTGSHWPSDDCELGVEHCVPRAAHVRPQGHRLSPTPRLMELKTVLKNSL